MWILSRNGHLLIIIVVSISFQGGATSYIWGWLLLSLISLCIAASLGEIASVFPTSGGV